MKHKFSESETALNGVNLRLKEKSIYGFIGSNGAGKKTTTVKLILGLLERQRGEIKIFGKDFEPNRVEVLRNLGSMIENPNNIDVLIAKDSAKASEYINKLTDFLHYTIYKTKSEKILLSDELNYIEKYLELQKIRASNADYIKFEIEGDAENLTIAPMTLFPFIENAFKHTENKKSSSRIDIKILIENKKLIFDCENTFEEKVKIEKADGGLGNELIEKRLMLLYANKHSLETGKNEPVYKVKLTVDLV